MIVMNLASLGFQIGIPLPLEKGKYPVEQKYAKNTK